MNVLQIFNKENSEQLSNDLDALMRSTERFGKLSLSRIDNSWWARIEMNTNVTGSTFKIESDFSSKNPQTPIQAVRQCVERMHAALKTLGGQQ